LPRQAGKDLVKTMCVDREVMRVLV